MRDLLSGAALGALVGLLVGLATSPVVGAVVGALIALLASFFGLQGGAGPLPAASPLRVLGFSAAAAAALLAGLYLRAGDGLAPTLAERRQAWESAGFEPRAAAELVAFERLGVLRGDWQSDPGGLEAAGKRASVLFAGEAATACDALQGRSYPQAAAYAEAFAAEGGAWQGFATTVPADLPEADRLAVFAAAVALVCE
ncbi:MAG: hypothetical protein WD341_13685 [Tistlia sp.]|uniref:hypothetical protein n=1 Tax=Tistlia sp. TaxID=3057121 RepID=UPI0034A3594C